MQNSLLWHWLKEKFSLVMKSYMDNQFLFCKKEAFENTDFSHLNCVLEVFKCKDGA